MRRTSRRCSGCIRRRTRASFRSRWPTSRAAATSRCWPPWSSCWTCRRRACRCPRCWICWRCRRCSSVSASRPSSCRSCAAGSRRAASAGGWTLHSGSRWNWTMPWRRTAGGSDCSACCWAMWRAIPARGRTSSRWTRSAAWTASCWAGCWPWCGRCRTPGRMCAIPPRPRSGACGCRPCWTASSWPMRGARASC